MLDHLKINASELTLDLDSLDIPFTTLNQGIIGQPRAQSALAFGIAMRAPGYNIFVMGDPGSGRLSMVNDYLSDYAKSQEPACAYAYVDNFDNPREPVAVQLTSGEGHIFFKDIENRHNWE